MKSLIFVSVIATGMPPPTVNLHNYIAVSIIMYVDYVPHLLAQLQKRYPCLTLFNAGILILVANLFHPITHLMSRQNYNFPFVR